MAPRKLRSIRVEGNLAYVPLTKGYEAMIDAVDAPQVGAFNWCAHEIRKQGVVRKVYAVRNAQQGGRNTTILMHRDLLDNPLGLEVDHKDCDGLNNRRNNLRTATSGENSNNQLVGVRNTSGFKGVSWHRRAQKWVAEIKADRRKRYLGLFVNPADAADAYAKASAELHGEFGRTR